MEHRRELELGLGPAGRAEVHKGQWEEEVPELSTTSKGTRLQCRGKRGEVPSKERRTTTEVRRDEPRRASRVYSGAGGERTEKDRRGGEKGAGTASSLDSRSLGIQRHKDSRTARRNSTAKARTRSARLRPISQATRRGGGCFRPAKYWRRGQLQRRRTPEQSLVQSSRRNLDPIGTI